jgi:hypothetical protein
VHLVGFVIRIGVLNSSMTLDDVFGDHDDDNGFYYYYYVDIDSLKRKG